MIDQHAVQVRRIYDEPRTDDGTRVLVDRLWPRGMSKARARLNEWCRTVAPSTELRTWYHHEPERFEEFTRRYLFHVLSGRHDCRVPVIARYHARRDLTTQVKPLYEGLTRLV